MFISLLRTVNTSTLSLFVLVSLDYKVICLLRVDLSDGKMR